MIKTEFQITLAAANQKKKTADLEKKKKRGVFTKHQFRGFVRNQLASLTHINCRHTSYIKAV